MGVMRALIWQEWRDQRVSVCVLTVVALLACALMGQMDSIIYDTKWVGLVLPFLIAAFVGITAADLLVCEERDGRIHLQTALPISPIRIWMAKTVYLALIGAVFVAIMATVNTALIVQAGQQHGASLASIFFDVALPVGGPLLLAVVLLFVGTVLFFSALLQRRSVAVWCATALFVWLIYLSTALESSRTSQVLLKTPFADAVRDWMNWTGIWGAFVLPVTALLMALAAGSIFGFRPAYVLEGRGLRRITLSLCAGLGPLLVGGAAVAYSVADFTMIEPHGRQTRVHHLVLSPDDEKVAAFVVREDSRSMSPGDCGVFLIDVQSGELESLKAYGVWPVAEADQVWAADDSLIVWGWTLGSRERLPARLDLSTGEQEQLAKDDGWVSTAVMPHARIQRRWLNPGFGRGKPMHHEISWTGGSIEVESRRGLVLDHEHFLIYYENLDHELRARDLRTEVERTIARLEAGNVPFLHDTMLSGGGDYLALQTSRGLRLIRLADGEDVMPFDDVSAASWDRRSKSDRYVLLERCSLRGNRIHLRSVLFDLQTGETVELPSGRVHSLSVTDRGEALCTDGVCIYLLEPGAAEVRVLYSPQW